MVSAVVLIQCAKGKVGRTAQALADLPGVSEVYSVAGQVDLVAVVRVNNNDDLADVVTNHMQTMDDIERTETLIAFQVFSKHDLERMFSIGMEG